MKKSKTSHKLAAAATLGMAAASSDAHAGVNASDLTTNLIASSEGFTSLIALFGYIAGFGLAVAGIFKLKEHVDNPGQAKMKDGVMRLAAGGGLLTLPYIANVMKGSVDAGTGNAVSATTISVFPG